MIIKNLFFLKDYLNLTILMTTV